MTTTKLPDQQEPEATPRKAWPRRHPVLTVGIAMVAVVAAAASIGDGGGSSTSSTSTSSASTKPLTPSGRFAANVAAAGVPKAKGTVEQGYAQIRFPIEDNLTAGLTRDGLVLDVFKLASAAKASGARFRVLHFEGDTTLVDQYGKTSRGMAFSLNFSGPTVRRTVWSNPSIQTWDGMAKLAHGPVFALQGIRP